MENKTHPDVVSLASVKPGSISWLWKDRIAIGKLSIIAGDPGLGKSLLAIELASIVSRGASWPSESTTSSPGGVLIMSAEDDLSDTIVPRLIAANADRSRIRSLTMVVERGPDGQMVSRRVLSLADHVSQLEDAIRDTPNCRLVILDPISAFTSHADTHKNSDVRGLLAPVADLAQRQKVAIVAISHLNKSSGPAMYRTMGSLAFIAAARAAFVVVKDKEDSLRRLFVPVKNNLGNDSTGLAYRVLEAENKAPYLFWEADPISISADLALESDSAGSERDDAIEWLEDALSLGAVETTELQKLAKMAGHSWRTVQRAKKDLGVKARKLGFAGKWTWELPKAATDSQGSHIQGVAAFN